MPQASNNTSRPHAFLLAPIPLDGRRAAASVDGCLFMTRLIKISTLDIIRFTLYYREAVDEIRASLMLLSFIFDDGFIYYFHIP